jgi:uncharacterized RDD family membrane protein YckC
MTTENPYEAPKSTAIEPQKIVAPFESLQASRGKRFGTFLIDYICVLLLGIVVGVVLASVGMAERLENMSKVGEYFFGSCLMYVFYLVFEGCFGRTPGKWIVGTRTVDLQGNAPTIKALLVRTLCRFIPFEAFSIFGAKAICWHDRFSDTRVLDLRKATDFRAGRLAGVNPPQVVDPQKPDNWGDMSEAQKAIWEMQQQQKR